ncbi:hypothetical protein CP533_6760 [Ophiocordyceps camponoti-saundersi (nom. inval.)]|nr:hypothetical protein CP533_6760 [Ophiocordyceps camponoti-saundersi (nom. inval.)]
MALPTRSRILLPSLGLYPPNTAANLFDSAAAHFSSIPWCASQMRPSRPDGPDPVLFVPQGFNPASDGEDQFFGSTLGKNPRALRHMLCLFRPDDAGHLRDPARPVSRISTLFALGDEGLSGYRGVLHGGIVCSLLDESQGIVHELNAALDKATTSTTYLTAALTVNFLRPAPAQGELCVTAWVESVQGRKILMGAELTGADGSVFATSRSTWVALREKL